MESTLDPSSTAYFHLVRNQLIQLGEDLLIEDIDLICKYVVLRFLKTSPHANPSSTPEAVMDELEKFTKAIYPFLVTFITVTNSPSLLARSQA